MVAVDADVNSGQVRRSQFGPVDTIYSHLKLGHDHMVLSQEAALGYGSPTVES